MTSLVLLATYAPGGISLIDAQGTSPLISAVAWLNASFLGSAATAIAVIAVASIGLMTLAGRVSVRRSVSIILGCFIIFGASSIVAGIRGFTEAYPNDRPVTASVDAPPPATPPAATQQYDPYAGAAVPIR